MNQIRTDIPPPSDKRAPNPVRALLYELRNAAPRASILLPLDTPQVSSLCVRILGKGKFQMRKEVSGWRIWKR